MEDELTSKMHEEFKISKDIEIKHMKINDYIKKIGVKSADDLSVEQILIYYERYNDMIENKVSVLNFRLFRKRKGFPKAIAEEVLRESLRHEPNYFGCGIILGESCDENSRNDRYFFETIGREEITDC